MILPCLGTDQTTYTVGVSDPVSFRVYYVSMMLCTLWTPIEVFPKILNVFNHLLVRTIIWCLQSS